MNGRIGRAVVVGASSGIGHEMARILIADGWTVGVAARRIDQLEGLCQLAPDRVKAARIDVTRENADVQLLRLVDELGGMDLYIHVAGIGKRNPALEADTELRTVQTNAYGFCRMIGCAYRYMASRCTDNSPQTGLRGDAHRSGQIAAVSSIAGTMGLGAAPAYSATKALQACYLEALAQLSRMRGLNITLTDIRPGFVDTALLGGNHYPMLMPVGFVARKAVRAIYRRQAVCIIDGRWRVVTALWRLIPHRLWRRLRIG